MNSTPKETGGRPCRLRGVALFPLHLKRQCPGGTFLDLLRDRFCTRGFEVDPGSLLHVEDKVKSAETDARVDADARIETNDDGVVYVLLNLILHRVPPGFLAQILPMPEPARLPRRTQAYRLTRGEVNLVFVNCVTSPRNPR